MCEYGFTEGTDYTPYNFVHPQNGQDTIDHQLTIAMAKEISMLQRTEKGKMARQYFIKIQEAWNTPEMVMARALKMADRQIIQLTSKIEEQQPLVLFAETCKASDDTLLIRDFAKVLCKKGYVIGAKRLYKKFRDWRLLYYEDGRNKPYQKYVDCGYFEVTEFPYGQDELHLSLTTRITPTGQQYVINRLFQETQKALLS
jgi:anti-repressor protein